MKNWPVKKLGEVIKLSSGKFLPKSKLSEKFDYPVYGANGVTGYYKEYLFEKPKIVIGRVGSTGAINLSEPKSWITDNALFVDKFLTRETDFNYLLLFLKTFGLSKIQSQAVQPVISQTAIYQVEIPVPPISEQRRIVKKLEKILAKISQASTLRRESEKETNQIMKVSVRKTLLSIKDSTELGSLCDVTKLAGFEFTKYVKYQENGEIIALRGLNIKNRCLDLSKIKYIPTETSSFLKRSKLEKDDLVMSYAGTLGSIAIIPDSNKFHCAPNVSKIRIKNKKELLPQFLLWCLDSGAVLEQINYLSKIAAQPSISMTNIRKIKIPLPDLKEQEKIVAYLDSLSEKVQALQKLQQEQLRDLEALKQSVIHQAFQGEL